MFGDFDFELHLGVHFGIRVRCIICLRHSKKHFWLGSDTWKQKENCQSRPLLVANDQDSLVVYLAAMSAKMQIVLHLIVFFFCSVGLFCLFLRKIRFIVKHLKEISKVN